MFLTQSFFGDILLIILISMIGLHTYYLFKKKRWFALDPLNAFWAGIFICYVYQSISGSSVLIAWHNEGVFIETLLATIFGVAFVLLGYESKSGAYLAKKIPQPPARLSSPKLLLASLVAIAVGFLGYAYVISMSGGMSYWLSIGRGGTDYELVKGYIPEFTQALPAGVALLLFWANLKKVPVQGKILAWVAGVAMCWWFLYLGTRSRLIGFTIVMLAAYYLPRRRNPHLALLFVIMLALQVIVDFQANYRSNFINLSFNFDQIDKDLMWKRILPSFMGGDKELKQSEINTGSELNCAMAVIELVPDKVSYNYGYGFLQIFTNPIPQAVWPSKIYPHLESVQGVLREGGLSMSVNAGVKNQSLLMGPAFSFTGSWFYVGGYIGLMIGGSFVGIMLRTIRKYYDFGRRNQGMIIIYPFLVVIGFIEASATPVYWIYSLPFVIILYIVILFLCAEKAPLENRLRRVKSRVQLPNRSLLGSGARRRVVGDGD